MNWWSILMRNLTPVDIALKCSIAWVIWRDMNWRIVPRMQRMFQKNYNLLFIYVFVHLEISKKIPSLQTPHHEIFNYNLITILLSWCFYLFNFRKKKPKTWISEQMESFIKKMNVEENINLWANFGRIASFHEASFLEVKLFSRRHIS